MGDVAKGVKNFKSGLKDEDDDDKVLANEATETTGEAEVKRTEPADGRVVERQ
jgi:Sec-independent protein translocase protein TatA